MNLFDKTVTEALQNQPNLENLRIVVEKELLHHDILRLLQEYGFLNTLTFIGGTALRDCYGAVRLSEDLDFTGGIDFKRDSLAEMGSVIVNCLEEKYNFPVMVSAPEKDIKNMDTWKIKIQTRPHKRNIPTQRINIDICAIPSYDKKHRLLLNPYGINMGTNGLIIQVQSCEEIYTDKLLAFALRPNRIKYRDLWDILWLHQKSIQPHMDLLVPKLQDRKLETTVFLNAFEQRCILLNASNIRAEFEQEMLRFLPDAEIKKALNQPAFWTMLTDRMHAFYLELDLRLR